MKGSIPLAWPVYGNLHLQGRLMLGKQPKKLSQGKGKGKNKVFLFLHSLALGFCS